MPFSIKPILTRGTPVVIGFSLLVVLFTLPSCEETVTPPVAPAGRRDYAWTFDTLRAHPGDSYKPISIWASSPSDVWAIGNADASDLSKWHYDGTAWQRDTQRISSSLFSVWGFSSEDVWTCEVYGNPGVGVWRFNGTSWQSMGSVSSTGPDVILNSIWGDRPDNLYFVGATGTLSMSSYRGLIVRYDGNSFQQIPIRPEKIQFVDMRRDSKGTGRYYLTGIVIATVNDSMNLYELDGNTLRIINVVQLASSLSDLDGEVYFTFGKKIFMYDGAQFLPLVDLSGTPFLGRMWGRGVRDFFSEAVGGLGHYNGMDFEVLIETNMEICDMCTLANEVFVLCSDNQAGVPVIIHGVLKGD
jgi:hypothetical protein